MTQDLAPAAAKSLEALADHPEWMKKLDAESARFVTEYLVDCDAKGAVLRAGILPEGHTVVAVTLKADKLMKNGDVCHAIWQATRTILGDGIRANVLHKLAAIAFANAGDFFEFDDQKVTLKNSKQMSRDMLAAVKKVKQTRGNTESVELELHDPLTALQALMRLLEMERAADAKGQPGTAIQINLSTEALTVL